MRVEGVDSTPCVSVSATVAFRPQRIRAEFLQAGASTMKKLTIEDLRNARAAGRRNGRSELR